MALQLNAGASGGRGAQIYMGQGGTRHFTISSNVSETRVGTNSSTPLIFETAGTERMRIRGVGDIQLNSVTYNATVSATVRTLYIGGDYFIGGVSSIRESKKNIQNVPNVDWLYQLNPVTFNYRKKDEDGNYTEETFEDINYGLIAEDTQQVADFLINYDETNDGKKMIGIEYSRLVTPMLKAIQEQQAQIELLSNKIVALESK
jgi:hypothetical protein